MSAKVEKKKNGSTPNLSPYVKDSINDYVVKGATDAATPNHVGTKAAAYYRLTRLFVSERNHRIDSRGPARGDVTGRERHERQNRRGYAEGDGVVRRNAVEHASY
jgi:hypothetical protein